MNKKTIILLIIALVVIGFFLWKGSMKSEPVVETPLQVLDKQTQQDSTASIEADLNAINTEVSADEDLRMVDEDIKSL
ncbi:MAG: hypothetical protein AAB895_04085 [Patescibacteria group bacterium]